MHQQAVSFRFVSYCCTYNQALPANSTPCYVILQKVVVRHVTISDKGSFWEVKHKLVVIKEDSFRILVDLYKQIGSPHSSNHQ